MKHPEHKDRLHGPGGPGGPGGPHGPGGPEDKGNPQQGIAPPRPMGGMGGPPMGNSGPRPQVNDSKGTVFRIWQYLSKEKGKVFLAVVCVLLNSGFALLASYQVRPMLNGLLEGTGKEPFLSRVLFMLFLYIIAVFANFLQAKIMLNISQNALSTLRAQLFAKLQRLPVSYYDRHNNGEMMSRFTNDIDAINQMLTQTLVQLVSGIITLVGTFALMVYTNLWLTLVTLLMIPVFSFVGKSVGKHSRKYHKSQQESIGNLNGFLEEMVSGQKVVKVFSHQEESRKEFEKLNENYKEAVFRAQFLGGTMGPIMGSLGNLNYAITALVGGLLCVFQGFDIGGYTIFVNYSRNFSRPINEITMQMNVIYAALAGAERVFDMMDQEPEAEDPKDAITLPEIKGEIVIEDMSFGYIPEKMVLKNVSFTAKPSEKIAFVGATGAGKTTITNLLNRFYEIQGGSITIDGHPIHSLKRQFLRENIALVLQDTHLFTGTIRENIRYGRLDATDAEVEEAAKTANAHDFIMKLENGYDSELVEDGSHLSQGQRQVLNIARAALSKAPILVLDEATSSVDTRTEFLIAQALDRLMSSRTTLVIAHRLSTVRNANKIIVLDQGKIIEFGSHGDLMALNGHYHKLVTGVVELA